jgi:hypothetical protein
MAKYLIYVLYDAWPFSIKKEANYFLLLLTIL